MNRNKYSWIARKTNELRVLKASEHSREAGKQGHTLSERSGRKRKTLFPK